MELLTPEEMSRGEIEVIGYLPGASNYTYLARLLDPDGDDRIVVYKPQSGEAPLWDFEEGSLCRRELAAFLISEAGGFGFVPPTILRDGPYGLGAVQAFIDHDPTITAFEILGSGADELRTIAIFDLVTNNADRKAGHIFRDAGKRIWCVDHGICFHVEPKLRTVLWDFVGEPFTEPEKKLLEILEASFDQSLGDTLETLLSADEIEILRKRVGATRELGAFPEPGPGRPYPWPPR